MQYDINTGIKIIKINGNVGMVKIPVDTVIGLVCL